MQKLQSYSELVDKLKNDREYREFHEPTDKGLIDQENREYFNKTYGITSIHPARRSFQNCSCVFR